MRPMAWRASIAARSFSGSGNVARSRSTNPVWTVPGHTQLTRTPSATWSVAMAKVSARTAPFDAA